MDKVLFIKNPIYERYDKIMATNNRNQRNTNQNAITNKLLSLIKDNFVSILCIIIMGVWTLYSNAISLPDKINEINSNVNKHVAESATQFSQINTNKSELSVQMANLQSSMDSMTETISNMNDRLNNYEKVVFSQAIGVTLSSKTAPEMKIESVDEQNAIFLNMQKFDTNIQNMAVDLNTGRNYSSDDLINQNIFFTYTEGEQQILFLGKYDKNGAWDDRCLLNVYQDDKLVAIMDAMYENGTLVNYTQIMSDIYNEKEIWLKSVRTISDNGIKTGETWKYNRDKDVSMSFKFEQAVNTDIISIYQFEEEQDLVLNGYYNGNTSNGKYNDTTGNAYSVRFFEDGTVTTLYQGNFVNGLYDDTTGNAWYITRSFDTDYMYYKGYFGQGNTLNNDGYIFENPVSRTRINEIISGKTFECELKWYEQL